MLSGVALVPTLGFHFENPAQTGEAPGDVREATMLLGEGPDRREV